MIGVLVLDLPAKFWRVVDYCGRLLYAPAPAAIKPHTAATLAQDTVMSGSMPQLLETILSNVRSPTELCVTGAVSRRWYTMTCSNQLWRDICKDKAVLLNEHHDDYADERSYYKALYMRHTLRREWLTGEGVSHMTKPLMGPSGKPMKGSCEAISSRYMFVTSDREADSSIYMFCTVTGAYLRKLESTYNFTVETNDPQSGKSHKTEYKARRPSLVLCSDDGSIVVTAVGALMRVCNTDTNQQSTCCAIFLQDTAPQLALIVLHGNMLASVYCNQTTISVTNLESSREVDLEGHQTTPTHLKMSAERIATFEYSIAADTGMLKLWDMVTGTCLYTWREKQFNAKQLLLDAASECVVAVCETGRVVVWDTDTGVCTHRIALLHCHTAALQARMLCMIDKDDSSVWVLNLEHGGLSKMGDAPPAWKIDDSSEVQVLDSGVLVVVQGDCMHIWDVKSKQYMRQVAVMQQSKATQVVYSMLAWLSHSPMRMQCIRLRKDAVQCVVNQPFTNALTYIKHEFK